MLSNLLAVAAVVFAKRLGRSDKPIQRAIVSLHVHLVCAENDGEETAMELTRNCSLKSLTKINYCYF